MYVLYVSQPKYVGQLISRLFRLVNGPAEHAQCIALVPSQLHVAKLSQAS